MTSAERKTHLERASDTELVITRVFRAKPARVFEAWTKPELVRRWWAPASCGMEMKTCEADVRVGGQYTYALDGPPEVGYFYGEYLEITPPTRLVYTQFFSPYPGQPVRVTVSFEATGEHTKVISHEQYPSKETLEAALASGMEHGLFQTYDQLDALVAGEA